MPGATVPSGAGSDSPAVHVMSPAAATMVVPIGAPALPPPDYLGPPAPSITEIPSTAKTAPPANASSSEPGGQNDILNYQEQEPPAEVQQQLQSLRNFMEEGENTSSLGMVVREEERRASGGGEVDGLLILNVMPGTPAAQAGLFGYHTAAHSVLEGAAVAASLFFPPAIIAVAVVDGTGVGESYEMIIGIDGFRVSNFLDFSDHMRLAQPGEIVYLSILRNGKRIQVPVHIPPPPSTAAAR
ncbi:MAG: hypothetical protein ACREP6_00610 [Candidatus Binataceae bacterium]